MYAIGENIRNLREQKGKTQFELAMELFMTPSMVSSLETGNRIPSLMAALALSKYFGVTVEQLVEGNFSIDELYAKERG